MAELRGFLGKDFEIPADRRYDGARQYWVKVEPDDGGDVAVIGVSEPGVALLGAVLDIDVFPEPDEELVVDQEIAFATTKKNMKYFLSPVGGRTVAANAEATAAAVNTGPYETWLIKVRPEPGWDDRLLDAEAYARKLEGSEHATPEAAQAAAAGKGSPTCKSVYGGIKEA